MIEKNYIFGHSTVFDNVSQSELPVNLYISVRDVVPEDYVDVISSLTRKPAVRPMTIGEYKQLWHGKHVGPLSHPFSKEEKDMRFDISPWLHLPDTTYLDVQFPFEFIDAQHPPVEGNMEPYQP
jgi:hypothetical protein